MLLATPTYDYLRNVAVTLVQVLDNLVEIARKEILIRQELLLLQKLADFVLLGLLALRNDRHRVVVVLSVKDHVKARLLELLHGDAVGALSEDLHLVDASVLSFVVLPVTAAHVRR